MKIQEFITSLLEIKVIPHIAHWQTTSYAAHKALNKLYDGVTDYIDRIVESYQGATGNIITGYPTQMKITEAQDMVTYIKEKIKECRKMRETIIYEEIKAVIDELVEFLDVIVYKLKFLK